MTPPCLCSRCTHVAEAANPVCSDLCTGSGASPQGARSRTCERRVRRLGWGGCAALLAGLRGVRCNTHADRLVICAWPRLYQLRLLGRTLFKSAGSWRCRRTFQTQGPPQRLVPAPAWLSACCAQQRPAARESSTADQHTDAPVSSEVVDMDPARVVAGLKRVLQAAARRLEGIPPLHERACAQAQERAA